MMKKAVKKRIITVAAAIVVCAAVAVGAAIIYGKIQMRKIPELTFAQALEYTTRGNSDAVVTVGIIKDSQSSYSVYGEDAAELPSESHVYEIGSLTKTFTAALISKAADEGKLCADDTIDKYLALPEGGGYPTIKELATHTSGYKEHYFEAPMIANFFKGGGNDFYGVDKASALKRVGRLNMNKDEYGFAYSNFGYAVLGLTLESVYGADYTTIFNDFAQNELGLESTRVSDTSGDLGGYWQWKEDDAYLSAGGVVSNIDDMLKYAMMQLDGRAPFGDCHKSLKKIDASSKDYKLMGINLDEIGMAWITDKENRITWHNGGTGNYNCYLGFNPEKGVAVVVLSNLAPSYRIPATVLGVKLLAELAD